MFRHDILNEMNLGGKYRAVPEEPLPVDEIVNHVKQGGYQVVNEFQKLFFCLRWPSPSDLIALKLLADGTSKRHLTLETEFITTRPDVTKLFQSIGRGRTVESDEHQGMKSWVIEFLRSRGIRALEEVPPRKRYRNPKNKKNLFWS